MVFDISQLKKIRKYLSLTQHQFAKQSGVSQSMIAKIESGKLDPAYSKVKKIESALAALSHKEEKKARDIMTLKIISTKLDEKVLSVISLMKKHNISQIPVIDKNKVIGLITESSILSKPPEELKNAKARDVIIDSPPIISKETGLEVIKQLLNYYSCVLVKEKGELIGIITKVDLIRSLV